MDQTHEGRVIGGKYRLGRELGAGEHIALGEHVALKFLRAHVAAYDEAPTERVELSSVRQMRSARTLVLVLVVLLVTVAMRDSRDVRGAPRVVEKSSSSRATAAQSWRPTTRTPRVF